MILPFHPPRSILVGSLEGSRMNKSHLQAFFLWTRRVVETFDEQKFCKLRQSACKPSISFGPCWASRFEISTLRLSWCRADVRVSQCPGSLWDSCLLTSRLSQPNCLVLVCGFPLTNDYLGPLYEVSVGSCQSD